MTAFTGTGDIDGTAGFEEAVEKEEKLFGVEYRGVSLLMCGLSLWSALAPAGSSLMGTASMRLL